MEASWPELITAALSGGIILKLIEYIADWARSSYQSKKSAKEIVDAHLDPLLKAADEISGKTRSLAERDFGGLIKAEKISTSDSLSSELIGLLYLYAQFWSRIEILKQDSVGVSITSEKRGATLKGFLSCLESQRIRLVDRVHQKAIGEMTTHLLENGKLRSIGLVEFADKMSQDSAAKEWIAPLAEVLKNVHIKAYRQKVLVYGVVIHALTDTLDPKHHSTNSRPAYPNKLSKRSKRDIKHRVFGRYLRKVKNVVKYVGRV